MRAVRRGLIAPRPTGCFVVWGEAVNGHPFETREMYNLFVRGRHLRGAPFTINAVAWLEIRKLNSQNREIDVVRTRYAV